MKKFALILGTALASCFLTARAQDISFESSDNKPYLGIRLGLDISCPTDMKFTNLGGTGSTLSVPMFDNGAGFDIGAVYNIPLWKNLYFEPGLSLYYNTMGIDFSVLDSDDDYIPTETSLSASVRRFGFRVPFVAGYRADFPMFSLSAFTGPVLSANIIGREYAHINYGGIKETNNENIYGSEGMFRRVDLGWKIGVGATFNNFVLQLSGTIGMLNMVKSDYTGKYRDNNVALTLGYNFNF